MKYTFSMNNPSKQFLGIQLEINDIESEVLKRQLPAWRPGRSTDVQHESDKKVRDAVSYISKIQAVQGNGGDKDTYRACCRLAESGLTPLEQYQALLDWNAAGNAVPQWSATDLRRKLELAQKEMS